MNNDQSYDRWLDPCDNYYFYEQFKDNCLDDNFLRATHHSHNEKCRVVYKGFQCMFDSIERTTGIRCRSLLHAIGLFRNYIKVNFNVKTGKCDFQGYSTTPDHPKSTVPAKSTRHPSLPPTTKTIPHITRTTKKSSTTTKRTASPSPTRRTTTYSYTTTTASTRVSTDSKIPSASGSRDVNPAVIGGIVGSVAVVVVALFLLYICRRKNTNNGYTENTPHRSNVKETRHVCQTNYGYNIPQAVIKQTGHHRGQDQVIIGGHHLSQLRDAVKENAHQNHSYISVGNTVENVDTNNDDTEDIYMEISEVRYETLQAAHNHKQDQYGTLGPASFNGGGSQSIREEPPICDYLEPKPVYSTTTSREQYMNFNRSGIQSNVSNLENRNIYTELISAPYYENKKS